MWKILGDADWCARLDPRLQKAYGVKLYVGKNGRNYVDPPPPLKRLQVSLAIGLLTATLLGSAFAFIWHFIAQ
jgi:hypothetical protein